MHDSWGSDRDDEDGIFITPDARGAARSFNMFDFMDGFDGYGESEVQLPEVLSQGLGGGGNHSQICGIGFLVVLLLVV